MLAGGAIHMEPQLDGSYIARCEFYPLILGLKTNSPAQAEPGPVNCFGL
jgi:hypothetical protein